MTKKHFDELAKIITEAQEYINDADLYKIANRVADYCSTQSHTFDRERFLKVCGFKDYELISCDNCNGTQYFFNTVTKKMELCFHNFTK